MTNKKDYLVKQQDTAIEGNMQWCPDMIYFNNTEVKASIGYEDHRLYGHNACNEYLEDLSGDVSQRISANCRDGTLIGARGKNICSMEPLPWKRKVSRTHPIIPIF